MMGSVLKSLLFYRPAGGLVQRQNHLPRPKRR